MAELCVCPYCEGEIFYPEAPRCTECEDGWLNKCRACEQWSRYRENTNTQEELPVELRANLGQ